MVAKAYPELSPSCKAAVADLLGYMLMQRKIGSDEAAGYYSFISQIMDVSDFFRSCSEQFGKRWRKDRTGDMLSLAKNQSPELVIDAGCGTGVSSEIILTKLKPARLVLVDPIPQALELARKRLADISAACNIECRNGRVEGLQSIDDLQRADMVFMRSVMRYVMLADYGKVFTGANAILKQGGELIFDLPLKLPGEWLSEEDSPYGLISEVMHETFDMPALIQTAKNASNQAAVAEYVDKELKSAGFSVVEQRHFSTKIALAEGYNMVDIAIGDVFDGLRLFHPKAYLELSIYRDFMTEKLKARVSDLFKKGDDGVSLGLSVFRALRIIA